MQIVTVEILMRFAIRPAGAGIIVGSILLGALAIALPASAAPLFCDPPHQEYVDGKLVSPISAHPERYIELLREHGVDAVRVEEWSGCLRAYVPQPDGTDQMQFFDPSTFQRLQ